MLLTTERGVSFDDLHRYFAGCLVIDPNTGKPAKVLEINSAGEVAVAIAAPSRWSSSLFYRGREAEPFYNLGTYTTPELGWRKVGARTAYLYRRTLSGGGVRGLNVDRIAQVSTSNVRSNDLILEESVFDRNGSALCYAIFNPEHRSLSEAVNLFLSNQASSTVIVNPDVALLPHYHVSQRDAGNFLVAFQRNVVGVGNRDSVSLTNNRYIKYLGATDGIVLHCP